MSFCVSFCVLLSNSFVRNIFHIHHICEYIQALCEFSCVCVSYCSWQNIFDIFHSGKFYLLCGYSCVLSKGSFWHNFYDIPCTEMVSPPYEVWCEPSTLNCCCMIFRTADNHVLCSTYFLFWFVMTPSFLYLFDDTLSVVKRPLKWATILVAQIAHTFFTTVQNGHL